nr:hypothetical protein [Sphingomonas daechungensis]
MIADEVARPVSRVEHAEVAPCVLERLEEVGFGRRAAEAVDQQVDGRSPPGGLDQRVADAAARIVTIEDVEEDPDAFLRFCDDLEKGLDPLGAGLDQL